MSSKKISQREARRLKKRINELESERRAMRNQFGSDWPGVHLGTWVGLNVVEAHTARKLGFAIAAIPDGNTIKLYAVK